MSLHSRTLSIAAAACVGLTSSAVAAMPSTGNLRPGNEARSLQSVQFSVHYGYRRPYYGYDYGYRPYYRPYYAPPPPPVTYYESRPYVVRPAPRGYDPDAVARCASRFKSFNVHTGTYITYGGEEVLCPYLR